MKIIILFGSHRIGGTNSEIERMIKELPINHQFDFIHMADYKVESCNSCEKCSQNKRCILPITDNDHFQEIYDKFIEADAIIIITPVYAGLPSRLTALFERMTSVLFFSGLMNTDNNPLLNKKVGIFNYCSSGICDDSYIKILFQKFVMKNYSFNQLDYNYLNHYKDPNSIYGSLKEYIKQTILNL